jgi:ubiquinone/menaquinone biosynthesis C-methylase UbiE
MLRRWLAGQFARPHGFAGRYLIAPWLDRIAAPMNALVLAALDPRSGETVLEIGFGGGGLMAQVHAAGALPMGADVSAEMVARAGRRFGTKAEVALASVESLPFSSGAADKAASVNNLYFWADPTGGLAELARVVRPGGLLCVAFEPPEQLAKWPGSRFGFRMWSEAQVRALMQGAGFADIRATWGTGRKPDRFLCLTGVRSPGDAA